MAEDMDRNHVFYRIVNSLIRLMFAGAVFFLLLHSLYSTSFVGRLLLEDGNWQERTLNIADSPLRHFLVFALMTAVFLAGRKIVGRCRENGRIQRLFLHKETVFWGLTLLTLVCGAAYVLLTKFYPSSDPAKVYAIAMQWRRGDFSSFAEGEYLFRYPFQSGIVLFFYLLSFLVGMDHFVGLQLVNVICLAAIYGLLVKQFILFSALDGGEGQKSRQGLVYLGLLVWTPLAFYVTYLYGILPGMAFSLGAVYFAGRYLCTRRYRYIAAASLCMGLATVIKMNCLIYLIAIACFLAYDAVEQFFFHKKNRKKGLASLLFIVCMALSVALCTQLANRLVERISGQKLGEGEVMLSWVVMGMQEAPLGPGGYNGYNGDVFTKYHYDTEKITEACLEDLKKIVTRMSENPLDEGLPFLARKTAFQWNDPTFICLDRTRGRKAEGNVPLWLKSLIEGRGSVGLSIFLNYMQTLILLGVLLFLILRWRRGSLYELMGAVVFFGGWLFHMVWESSASYTIPYFLLLVPYGVCGMAEWAAFLEKAAKACGNRRTLRERTEDGTVQAECDGTEEGKRRGMLGKKQIAAAVLAAAFVLLLTAFTRTNLFDRMIALNDDLQGLDASAQFYQTGEWDQGF